VMRIAGVWVFGRKVIPKLGEDDTRASILAGTRRSRDSYFDFIFVQFNSVPLGINLGHLFFGGSLHLLENSIPIYQKW
jgi:hypothetical protein